MYTFDVGGVSYVVVRSVKRIVKYSYFTSIKMTDRHA